MLKELTNKEVKRGQMYLYDFPQTENNVQGGLRPCVVVSNDTNNSVCRNVNIVPITSRYKKFIPTHVYLDGRSDGLYYNSTALTEQIFTIDKKELGVYIGNVTPRELDEISAGLAIQMGFVPTEHYMSKLIGNIKTAFYRKHSRRA